jgi:hypothetical protein
LLLTSDKHLHLHAYSPSFQQHLASSCKHNNNLVSTTSRSETRGRWVASLALHSGSASTPCGPLAFAQYPRRLVLDAAQSLKLLQRAAVPSV